MYSAALVYRAAAYDFTTLFVTLRIIAVRIDRDRYILSQVTKSLLNYARVCRLCYN